MTDQHDKKQFDLDLSHGSPRIQPRQEKKKTQDTLMWFYIGSAGQIGISIVVPLLLGVFAGIWFDSQRGTKPAGVLIGLTLGLVLSIASLVHTVQRIIKSS